MSVIFQELSLSLYAFHLRNELTQNNKADEDANEIWKLCKTLGEKLNIKELKDFADFLKRKDDEIGYPPTQEYPKSGYLELLDKPENRIEFSIPNSEPEINGEVYAYQIHDTYALDIGLRFTSDKIDLENLNKLNPENIFRPDSIKAELKENFLGQTLLLFAKPSEDIGDDQELAKKCLTYLFSNSDNEYFQIDIEKELSSGFLLGSPIFEYDNGQEIPGKNLHILIWINRNTVTDDLEKKGDYYPLLINLLCCRNNILFSYSESRKSYEKAKGLYQKLKEYVKHIKQLPTEPNDKLNKLKNQLNDLMFYVFDYSRHLRDLKIQHTSINTNTRNYQLYLNKLQKISVKESIKEKDDLQFLQDFLSHAENKLAEQIKVDISYLNTGKELYGEMLNFIRGIVEIDQAKLEAEKVQLEAEKAERDKSFERNIQVIGVTLGSTAIVSGIASDSIAGHIDKPFKLNPKYPFHPMISSFVGSFSVTIVFLLAILWLWNKRESNS